MLFTASFFDSVRVCIRVLLIGFDRILWRFLQTAVYRVAQGPIGCAFCCRVALYSFIGFCSWFGLAGFFLGVSEIHTGGRRSTGFHLGS